MHSRTKLTDAISHGFHICRGADDGKAICQPRNSRPLVTHGVQSGEVGVDSGVGVVPPDRPARMQIEIATTDSSRMSVRRRFVMRCRDRFYRQGADRSLPPGQDVSTASSPGPVVAGHLSPPRGRPFPDRAGERRSVSFAGRETPADRLGHRRVARASSTYRQC